MHQSSDNTAISSHGLRSEPPLTSTLCDLCPKLDPLSDLSVRVSHGEHVRPYVRLRCVYLRLRVVKTQERKRE
eukprot:2752-Eustigmatos_ZCMA.PRE.1